MSDTESPTVMDWRQNDEMTFMTGNKETRTCTTSPK
jgi:hypothetical protein